MIIYETNKNWLSDIRHLFRSWTMTKIIRSVMWIGLYCTAVAVIGIELVKVMPNFSSSIFSLLGIVLSILLVFRTNTAYDRWWEGRNHWGALVNHTRNIAVMAQITFPTEDRNERHRLAALLSNFAIALKEHLRSGVKQEELIYLTESDNEK